MAAKKEIAAELLAEAKRLYEQTLAPVDDIAAMLGLTRTPFYRRVREGGWRGRRARVGTFEFVRALSGTAAAMLVPTPAPAEQPRAEAGETAVAALPEQRLAMALRVQHVIECEMDAMVRILAVIKPSNQIEAEHGARTLAGVARALRELKALTEPNEVKPPDEADDHSVPLDIDEFRNELARRINEFVDAERRGEGEADGETVAGAR
jgi:hypothetical protein